MPEIRELLRQAAHEPSDGPDLDDVRRRAARLRRSRRVKTAGLAGAAVLLGATLGEPILDSLRGARIVELEPAAGDSAPGPGGRAETAPGPDERAGADGSGPDEPPSASADEVLVEAAWELESVSEDGRLISVSFRHGGCLSFDSIEAVESDSAVRISVFLRRPAEPVPCPTPIDVATATAELEQPLGDRRLVPAGASDDSIAEETAAEVDEQWIGSWPEDTAEAAAEAAAAATGGEHAWRTDPDATAGEFARQVLGWDQPIVAETETSEEGMRDVVRFVRRGPNGPEVEVGLAARGDAGWWSVTRFWGGDPAFADLDGSVSVRDGVASVIVGYWGPAASAELRLGYAGEEIIEEAFDPPAAWEGVVLPFPHEDTGHVMVLFRDDQGEVFAGWGTALPAGDFAAG